MSDIDSLALILGQLDTLTESADPEEARKNREARQVLLDLVSCLGQIKSTVTYTLATLGYPSKDVRRNNVTTSDPDWIAVHAGRAASSYHQLAGLLKASQALLPTRLKMDSLAKTALEALKVGLKQYGEYSFSDKGPHEVMDIYALAASFREAGVEAAVEAFREIRTADPEHGDRLASAIVGELEEWYELWGAHGEYLNEFY